MAPVRRLTAVLSADVAGYPRLMGVDEERTHERLKAHLRELIEPKIKEHRGRIVKNTGDGFLPEFASVVDAVRCVVANASSGTCFSTDWRAVGCGRRNGHDLLLPSNSATR